ncbi:hypothetical protein AB0M20_23040 [Actinoplanes sp. NPDC051633]|uniref:hypothetical protein n=1 Tax=Actinoplanes sp. NPDC051633 TaxID=3155670 RepID=UPI003445AF52
MGTLVTLSLPPDSPVADLPWVITVGALDDDDWEPVVCGPYERRHALALAQAVVADEELMAVVEPLLPLVDAEAIREEIETARAAAAGDAPGTADDGDDEDDDGDDDWAGERVEPGPAPTAREVRAGFARLAARLTAG